MIASIVLRDTEGVSDAIKLVNREEIWTKSNGYSLEITDANTIRG